MKLIFLISIIALSLFPIFSDSVSNKKWSPNFGIMNWNDAKKKCESVKMRLPTILELKDAFRNNEMKTWTNDKESNLWSSDTINEGESAKILTTDEGLESSYMKFADTSISVRCIQSNFKRKERKSGIKWSDYLGTFRFESAKEQCAMMKMKLPTIKQFETALKVDDFQDFPIGSYWTSEIENKSYGKMPYAYFIHWTNNHSHTAEPSEDYSVRCVK